MCLRSFPLCLETVARFEEIPNEVKLQVAHDELVFNTTQAYSYRQRSGHATTTHRCDTVDHQIPRQLTFITR